jgi:predicted secreted protein
MLRPIRDLGLLAAVATAAALSIGNTAHAAEEPDNPPLLGVSADVSREVANDEMNVVMRVERQSADLASANRDALERINALLAKARSVPGVDANLAGVGSSPVYAESRTTDGKTERAITGWHVHADAALDSRDIQALSRLVGELGEDARILSLGFSVSKETRARIEAELLAEAAKAFNERAGMVAKSLGFAGFEIERVHVGTAGTPRPYRPVAQEAMMMKAAAPDFSGSAGESTLSANANGQVWLRR